MAKHLEFLYHVARGSAQI